MAKPEKLDIFRKQLEEHRSYIYTAVFLSIFVAYLPVAPIVYMRTVFGPVVNSQSLSFLTWLFLLLLFALIINGILEWIRERILLSGTMSFISGIEDRVFSATFEQNVDKWNDGSRAFSNLRNLRNFMVSPISGAFFDAPFAIMLLLVIFLIHPLMGAFSLLGLFIALLIGLIIEKKLQPDQLKAGETQNLARRELTSLHNNALYVNSMGNLPFLFKKWFLNHKQFLVFQSKSLSLQSLGSSVSMVVMMVQGSMILGVGTLLTLIGMMDLRMAGNLIIAKFIGALAIRPTIMIVMGWSQVISVRESVKELRYFLQTATMPLPSAVRLPPPKGVLIVSDISFQIRDTEKKILDSISFSLQPGNICAVLGESGSGKSSLARILVGYTNPTKGSVRLDGVAIGTWNKIELCDHIGYVPQDLQLFGGDVVANITRFKEPNESNLEKVCAEFDLNEIFESYKSGKKINLSDDLFDIPGGMKQRIALARAFYSSPNFIVLDEPTSSLDATFENKFLNLLEYHRDRGALIVINTHNQRILKMANFILALKEGRQKIFDSKENIKTKMNLSI